MPDVRVKIDTLQGLIELEGEKEFVASPTYSPRCRVASAPPRWREKGTSDRGVCFAAGFGLWVGAGGFGAGYRGDRGPVVYGPAGIRAAAM